MRLRVLPAVIVLMAGVVANASGGLLSFASQRAYAPITPATVFDGD